MQAEYNIWRDPPAAEYVFQAVDVPGKVFIVPLDASMDAPVTRNEWRDEVMDAAQDGSNIIAKKVGQEVLDWIDFFPQNLNSSVICATSPYLCPLVYLFLADFLNQMHPFDTIGVAIALDQCRQDAPVPYKLRVELDGVTAGATVVDPTLRDRAEVGVFKDFNTNVFKTYFFERMRGVDRGAWSPGVVYPGGGTFRARTVVTLGAKPADGYDVRWSGTDNDSEPGLVNAVTMNSDRAVTVEFVEQQPLITTESGGDTITLGGSLSDAAARVLAAVLVQNPTPWPVDWEALADQLWIKLSLGESRTARARSGNLMGEQHLAGTLAAGESVGFQVDLDVTGLRPGTYNATLRVTAGAVERTFAVVAVIQEAGAVPVTDAGQKVPGACGVGLCGAGGAGMMPVIMLGLALMKADLVRRRRRG